MRYGFTTGSCGAAAAKAAAYMLLSGRKKNEITIETPKGIPFPAKIEAIQCAKDRVRCGVRKDGGDDPDITTGLLIMAEVEFLPADQFEVTRQCEPVKQLEPTRQCEPVKQLEPNRWIYLTAGEGIGRVTKPGLDQPVGEAAINHVPREMLVKEVLEVCEVFDYQGGLKVTLSIPGGEEVAQKTFNPRLGIVGGLSILGTTGVVEPMSSQALLDTILVELKVRYAQGQTTIAVTPGNYGQDYMKTAYGYDLEESVKCSNFIGATLDMAADCGFQALLLTGHIGKLIKVAGGIMNTHSREGDCRMELLVAAAIQAGADLDTARALLAAVTTEEGVNILAQCGKLQETMAIVVDKIQENLTRRANGRLQVECILYATGVGELGKTKGATKLLDRMKNQNPNERKQ